MRRSNFRRRVWLPATRDVGVEGLRFHDLRHTAATLAAASGASLRALMSRIGHASAAAAIRYQHVIDGQDADIVDYLERFDLAPPEPCGVRVPRRRASAAMTAEVSDRDGLEEPRALGEDPMPRQASR